MIPAHHGARRQRTSRTRASTPPAQRSIAVPCRRIGDDRPSASFCRCSCMRSRRQLPRDQAHSRRQRAGFYRSAVIREKTRMSTRSVTSTKKSSEYPCPGESGCRLQRARVVRARCSSLATLQSLTRRAFVPPRWSRVDCPRREPLTTTRRGLSSSQGRPRMVGDERDGQLSEGRVGPRVVITIDTPVPVSGGPYPRRVIPVTSHARPRALP
jgi:hypothetical protein